MNLFAIMECSGEYCEYAEKPLFLVRTEDEANAVVDKLNALAKWKDERSKESNLVADKWRDENPAPPRDTRDLARQRQIEFLLTQDFKEELKAPLKEELAEIKYRLQDYDDWLAKKRDVYTDHFDSMTMPDDLSNAVYDAKSYANYSYIELEVKNI